MAIPLPDQWHLLPKTRAEAKQLGVAYYFTGKPCKRGHVAPYLTSIGRCTTCSREADEAARVQGIAELGTERYYATRRARTYGFPSFSPEARRTRHDKQRSQRRTTQCLRIDRRPLNQSKEERKAIKAFETEVRARGNHPDHIVAFFHPQLRGLHTLANLQEASPRRNIIKGNRTVYTAEQIEAFIAAGMAVRVEDVDDETGVVNWPRYPQHLPRND